MTIVAIWLEKAGFLWSVADTRISRPGENGQVILTDSGAKLLTLPVVCRRQPKTSEEIGTVAPHYSGQFGFSFAGDCLPALMTYATATTFLQNLSTPNCEQPPKLSEVASLVARIAQQFSDQVRFGRNSGQPQFESAVFGWCPREKRFQIFHIHSIAGAALSTEELNPNDENEIVILGSGKVEFERRLKQLQQVGDIHGRRGRLPKLVVESMALNGSGAVGGSLSIGIANMRTYSLYSWMRPVKFGRSEAYLSFNGFDIERDVGSIGQYTVGMFGMV